MRLHVKRIVVICAFLTMLIVMGYQRVGLLSVERTNVVDRDINSDIDAINRAILKFNAKFEKEWQTNTRRNTPMRVDWRNRRVVTVSNQASEDNALPLSNSRKIFNTLDNNDNERNNEVWNDGNAGFKTKQSNWVHSFQNILTKKQYYRQEATSVQLYPSQPEWDNDRILSQIQFSGNTTKTRKFKTILTMNGIESFVKPGRRQFVADSCRIRDCFLTRDRSVKHTADAILFQYSANFLPSHIRPPNQIWVMYLLESPANTEMTAKELDGVFNWTSTYRRDSDIAAPYEKFVPHDPDILTMKQMKNYAKGKTKKVAWFVSNCNSPGRWKYAKELSRYIQVDIFGACGPKKCSRGRNQCFQMLKSDYKFYLAFENSNCRDYITEKLYVNALQNDILPIVMGAHPEDYKRAAPVNSYIHVDDFSSPKHLAEYLHLLDAEDSLYNQYFQWKGTGEFINTFFWCRLCAMLHADLKPKVYRDFKGWWTHDPRGKCIRGSWYTV